jgi:hypothetical protein
MKLWVTSVVAFVFACFLLFDTHALAAQTACPIANGCIGTSTSPAYGSLLIGGQHGEYEFIASSTFSSLTSPVSSVFGRTGAITAQAGDYTTSQVTEGSNLYFTNARAVSALTGQSNTLFTNGAGYLTSLSGAASSTLLTDNNTFGGNNTVTQPLSLTNTIGTTTIATGQGFTIGSSQFVLQQGSGFAGFGTNSPTSLITMQAATPALTFFNGTNIDTITEGATGALTTNTVSNSSMSWQQNGTTRLIINSGGTSGGGFVGISTTTASNTLTVASSSGPQLALADGTNSSFATVFRSIGSNFYIATSTFNASSSAPLLALAELPTNVRLSLPQFNSEVDIGSITNAPPVRLIGNTNGTIMMNGNNVQINSDASSNISVQWTSLTFTNHTPVRWGTTSGFPELAGTGAALTVLPADGSFSAMPFSVGSTTPFGAFTVSLNSGDNYSGNNAFIIASSTSLATTTLFSITNAGHIIASSTTATLSSCGTAPSIKGDDTHGRITVGSTANACTLTFQVPYSTTPVCVANNETGSITNTFSYVPSTTGITFTETSLGGDVIDYLCEGVSGMQ